MKQKSKEFGKDKKEVEMALVVRTDLGMTKGKIAAQCGHAVLGSFKSADILADKHEAYLEVLTTWMNGNGLKGGAIKCY